MILNIIRSYFERKGYQVITAKNGQIGLELFNQQRPDIVLVDLDMPLVTGIEVL